MRHDEVRDITAQMLNEVCNDVRVEPTLQPIPGIQRNGFLHATANTANDAKVDISARSFWTRGQQSFFDIRVFNPAAPSYINDGLQARYAKNERKQKKREPMKREYFR